MSLRHSASRKRHGRRKASAGNRRRLLLVPAILLSLLLGIPSGALAYWTTSGGGTASGSSGNVQPATNLAVAQALGASTITVAWVRSTSTNVTGYRVQHSVNSGAWTAACGGALLPPTTMVCNDTGLSHNSSYRYRVIAVKGGWTATSAISAAVLVDTVRPTVTVRRADGQTSPTNSSTLANPIRFTVEFTEPVTGFTSSDVVLTGTADRTSAIVDVSPTVGPAAVYTVSVRGAVSNGGTVIASVPANAAIDNAGNGNDASTSPLGNSVTLDNVGPNAPAVAPTLTTDTFPATAPANSQFRTDHITAAPAIGFSGSGVPADATSAILYRSEVSGQIGESKGTVTLSGTTYTATDSTAGERDYFYSIAYSDAMGNIGTRTPQVKVTVDRTKPTAAHDASNVIVPGLIPLNRITGSVPSDAGLVTAHSCARTAQTDCGNNAITVTPVDGKFTVEYSRGLLGLGPTMSIWVTVYDAAGNFSPVYRFEVAS